MKTNRRGILVGASICGIVGMGSVFGCRPTVTVTSNTTGSAQNSSGSHYTVGTHPVTADGCTSNGGTNNSFSKSNIDGTESAVVGCGNTSVDITEDSLKVNGKDFGKLKSNDKVEIAGATVTVNGAPRTAVKP